MAAYATVEDVLARYEASVIDRVCWDTEADEPKHDRLAQGLEDAATEIDSYISGRYTIPVTPTPAVLRTINIDLGIYYTALTSDRLSDEIAMRAKNWRAHLVLIAKGTVGLGARTPTGEGSGSDDDEPSPGNGVVNALWAHTYRS